MPVRDTLSDYDQAVVSIAKLAMLNSFTGIVQEDGSPLNLDSRVVFASPERPYGGGGSLQADQHFDEATMEYEEALPDEEAVLQAIITGETSVDIERILHTLQTPVIGVTRMSMNYAMNRNAGSFPGSVSSGFLPKWDAAGNFQLVGEAPRPWDIEYQIDIHARFRADANRALRFYMVWPDPVRRVPVNFGYPWGAQFIDFIMGHIEDTSALETDENERWIRHTIPFTVEAWLFESFDSPADVPDASVNPYANIRKVRTVKQIETRMYEAGLNDELVVEVPIQTTVAEVREPSCPGATVAPRLVRSNPRMTHKEFQRVLKQVLKDEWANLAAEERPKNF